MHTFFYLLFLNNNPNINVYSLQIYVHLYLIYESKRFTKQTKKTVNIIKVL